MRSSDLSARLVVLLAGATALLATSGCSTTLAGGDLGEPAGGDDAGAPPLPVARGCAPFRDLAGVTAMTGAVRSLALPDGGALFVVDDSTVAGAALPSLALTLPSSPSLEDCLAGAAFAFGAASSALDPPTLSPLSAVVAGGVPTMYFTDPSGAVGVAQADPADGRFRRTAMMLWTSDRPPYGAAAVNLDGTVDLLGCVPAGFLDADCFLADVPESSVGDESSYAYYIGGGRFSPRVDDAWPMTSGAASYDLVAVPSENRWALVYTTPLGTTITVRSGLAPDGPWSSPIDVATCALADPDMFCTGLHAHPEVASAPGTIVVSYAPASFSSDVGARMAAEPVKWWPTFAVLSLPALP